MTQILAAYCINVTDIERSIEFWDGVMGIPLPGGLRRFRRTR